MFFFDLAERLLHVSAMSATVKSQDDVVEASQTAPSRKLFQRSIPQILSFSEYIFLSHLIIKKRVSKNAFEESEK